MIRAEGCSAAVAEGMDDEAEESFECEDDVTVSGDPEVFVDWSFVCFGSISTTGLELTVLDPE